MSCKAELFFNQGAQKKVSGLAFHSNQAVLKKMFKTLYVLCSCVFFLLSSVSRLCNPVSDSSKKRVYSSPVSLHFHSDESLTHKGFYLLYRAFSPEGSK